MTSGSIWGISAIKGRTQRVSAALPLAGNHLVAKVFRSLCVCVCARIRVCVCVFVSCEWSWDCVHLHTCTQTHQSSVTLSFAISLIPLHNHSSSFSFFSSSFASFFFASSAWRLRTGPRWLERYKRWRWLWACSRGMWRWLWWLCGRGRNLRSCVFVKSLSHNCTTWICLNVQQHTHTHRHYGQSMLGLQTSLPHVE